MEANGWLSRGKGKITMEDGGRVMGNAAGVLKWRLEKLLPVPKNG